MKNNKYKLQGITLVETLLYIGIFTLIMFTIMNFMLSTQESNRRNDIKTEIHKTSEFLSLHLSDSFEKTLSVNKDTSIFNSNQGQLDINFSSGINQYKVSNNKILFNNIPLTTPNITVTQFLLEPVYKGTDNIIGVEITIGIQSTKNPSFSEIINLLEIVR
ncbi:MAG TPA: hypothetical protein P5098_02020 [Candidatus Dojkabacteria bacterium]|jgi:hypothetical protein|nr:hypothetical protein [Candidatus Dojkabacteria bacterium]HRY74443.1 hypothetical protein [Candidatus Dojkabacteria bacterium]